MKVLFLDIDGVLISQWWAGRKGSDWSRTFDPDAIRQLGRIIEETDAHIVVSSSWRVGETLVSLREMFAAAGLPTCLLYRIIDLTPHLRADAPIDGYHRGDEIRVWLETRASHFEGLAAPFGPIESFVILDDDNDMGVLKPYLVQTTWECGLTVHEAGRAIDILNGPARRIA